jgi:HK97 family phage portal protein
MSIKTVYSAIKGKVSGFFSKALSPVDNRGWHVIMESFAGAWQSDVEINHDSVLSQTTVFACMTMIASDIGKLRLKLAEQTASRIWEEVSSPSFSPVLRKPNHYQTRQQFIEQWVISKLSYGNAYILKQRDNRGVVTALYVLDPNFVKVLVASNGDVFYQLNQDELSKIYGDFPAVPASEIIHDRMNCLFHPLVGLSPIFACGLAATQALKIQGNSAKFFENMSRPSGMLTAPSQIGDETATRLKKGFEDNFSGNNIGRLFVAGDGLTYSPITISPLDAQLVEQLKMSAELVCSTFHVPAYMVGAAPAPTYNNIEALSQQYYSQCLQSLIEAIEISLDEGLGLPYVTGKTLGTEFELDDLLRMDSATQIDALNKAVSGGWMKPDEARQKRNLAPVAGGDTPYLQQQNFSLAALAKRDALEDPFSPAKPEPVEPTEPTEPVETEEDETEKALHLLFRKSPEALIHA